MAKKPAKKPAKSKALKKQSRFSTKQLTIFALIFALVGGVVIWRSLAASPNSGGRKPGVPPLSLTRNYIQNSPNPSAPTDCMNEDDYHERDYYGSLSGSFSATEIYCNDEFSGGTYWPSGGEGLRAEAWIVGQLADMSIAAPTGEVHHAVLVGSSTSKHVTTYHYQTCFVPNYAVSSNTSGTSLSILYPGNPWVYTLSGNITQASYSIYSNMINAVYQKTQCPPSEQNLSP